MKFVKSRKEFERIGRRRFLGQASCAGLGYLTLANTVLNLKAMNASAISSSAAEEQGGYKALVCIYLGGGNDSYNMLPPYDSTTHAQYVAARGGLYQNGPGLAIPQSELQNTRLFSPSTQPNWSLHPSMTGLHDLFGQDKVALVTNVGTLVGPTNKTQYYNGQNLPLGLYSHSDQTDQWQTGIPDQRTAIGWAGKIADLIGDCNGNQSISMNISLSGANTWQTGDQSIEYAMDPYNGPVGLLGYNTSPSYLNEEVRKAAVDSLMGQIHSDIFEKTYMDVIKNAHAGFLEFDTALQNAASWNDNVFPGTYLGQSMEMIAKVISVQSQLNFSRQVFFVEIGGWDHHDEVINNQQTMLAEVDEAMKRFQDALGSGNFTYPYIDGNGNQQTGTAQGIDMEDNVVTFMISEFARTLTTNGEGSDHAWGGNTLVMGGPVNGGNVFGQYPSMLPGSSQEIGLGRFIPTTSTDEYFFELAKWFGVPSSDMTTLFPNIGNFHDPFSSSLPIGFLNI